MIAAQQGICCGRAQETPFKTLLTSFGIENANVEPTRVHKSQDARASLIETGNDVDANIGEINRLFRAASVPT